MQVANHNEDFWWSHSRGVCVTQEASNDRVVRTSMFDGTSGTFSVPARTAAVMPRPPFDPVTPFACYASCLWGFSALTGSVPRARSGVHQAAAIAAE
jgi:hypothetical protein